VLSRLQKLRYLIFIDPLNHVMYHASVNVFLPSVTFFIFCTFSGQTILAAVSTLYGITCPPVNGCKSVTFRRLALTADYFEVKML
jgi:hypothetical protein